MRVGSRTFSLVVAKVVVATGGILAVPVGLRASGSGSIDTTGAILAPGNAPIVGDVVIDEAAELGAPPDIPRPAGGISGNFPQGVPQGVHLPPGLGGPSFRAQVDVTFAAGEYDFTDFEVDRGVTVTFDGPTTIRASRDVRIDGRVEMSSDADGAELHLRCAGDMTIAGHADVDTGLFVAGTHSTLVVHVVGALDVSADEGSRAHFSATGDGSRVFITVDPDAWGVSRLDAPSARISRTDFTADDKTEIACDGPVALASCDASGSLAVGARGGDGPAVHVTGGTYSDSLLLFAGDDDVTLDDGVTVRGDRFVVWGTMYGGAATEGHVSLDDGTSVEVAHGVALMGGSSLSIGADSTIRTTSGSANDYLLLGSFGNLRIGQRTLIEHAGGSGGDSGTNGSLSLAGRVVRVAGTLRGAGPSVRINGWEDVILLPGTVVDAGDGDLAISAKGAVVAEGGDVEVTAGSVDIRCATGDLDLDLATLDASAGRIVALSNGMVRLRGTYSAARDVQVISLSDVVNVSRATLTTAAVTSGVSGFVRLATYGTPTTVIIGGDLPSDGDDEEDDEDDAGKRRAAAADEGTTLISAVRSTLRTGPSDAQSGSILLQNQAAADGSSAAKATIRVSRTRARRTADGVVTDIKGQLSIPRRRVDLRGSGRVNAGATDERLAIDGGRSTLRGEGEAVSIRISRASTSKPAFTIQVREPSATAGETARVGFHRAGLHVRGSFRRPKTK